MRWPLTAARVYATSRGDGAGRGAYAACAGWRALVVRPASDNSSWGAPTSWRPRRQDGRRRSTTMRAAAIVETITRPSMVPRVRSTAG